MDDSVDGLDGDSGAEKDIELFWHCGQPVQPLGDGRLAICETVELELLADMAVEISEGWRSPVMDTRAPAPVIRGAVPARLPCERQTVWRGG